jgi:hypothetical protein
LDDAAFRTHRFSAMATLDAKSRSSGLEASTRVRLGFALDLDSLAPLKSTRLKPTRFTP